VENISCDDVQDFIEKLSKYNCKKIRLPSEAEWEYASRAESVTKYSLGDEIDCSKARRVMAVHG
jgi:formylglycine-generating enzyme required for sulfatase activity